MILENFADLFYKNGKVLNRVGSKPSSFSKLQEPYQASIGKIYIMKLFINLSLHFTFIQSQLLYEIYQVASIVLPLCLYRKTTSKRLMRLTRQIMLCAFNILGSSSLTKFQSLLQKEIASDSNSHKIGCRVSLLVTKSVYEETRFYV